MSSQDRKKIANIYLDPKTHATLKALAAHQETTLQGTAAHWLEEIQPMMQQIVEAFDEIKNGEDSNKVRDNLLAKGLRMASDKLTTEDDDYATDKRESD